MARTMIASFVTSAATAHVLHQRGAFVRAWRPRAAPRPSVTHRSRCGAYYEGGGLHPRHSTACWCGAATTSSSPLVVANPGEASEATAASDTTTTTTTARRHRVVFCLGGPGAGKGTQCERLEREYGLVHLSAGELLRRERQSGSADGELIESYLSEGKIVPVALSLGLLRREMERSGASRFVIDGFPRNQDNLDGWRDLMAHVADVDCVLFYDVPVDTLVSRMLSRGETSGRSDDNGDAARKRIDTFHEATLPLVEQFERDADIKVVRVPGDRTVDEVWELTKQAVEPFLEDLEEEEEDDDDQKKQPAPSSPA